MNDWQQLQLHITPENCLSTWSLEWHFFVYMHDCFDEVTLLRSVTRKLWLSLMVKKIRFLFSQTYQISSSVFVIPAMISKVQMRPIPTKSLRYNRNLCGRRKEKVDQYCMKTVIKLNMIRKRLAYLEEIHNSNCFLMNVAEFLF